MGKRNKIINPTSMENSHRNQYENLLTKQEGERIDMYNDAQDEAIAMNAEIDEHEARVNYLKGVEEGESIEKEKTQEKQKFTSVELPEEMTDKPMIEVYEYLKTNYGEERLGKMPDDLNDLPEELKETGTDHYFFGLLTRQDGKLAVPCASYYRDEWRRRAHLVGFPWRSGDRIVLLEG